MNNQQEVKFFYVGTHEHARRFLKTAVYLTPASLNVVDEAHRIEGYTCPCIIFIDPLSHELPEADQIQVAIDRLLGPIYTIPVR